MNTYPAMYWVNTKCKAKAIFNAIDNGAVSGNLRMDELPCGIYQVRFDAFTLADKKKARELAHQMMIEVDDDVCM